MLRVDLQQLDEVTAQEAPLRADDIANHADDCREDQTATIVSRSPKHPHPFAVSTGGHVIELDQPRQIVRNGAAHTPGKKGHAP